MFLATLPLIAIYTTKHAEAVGSADDCCQVRKVLRTIRGEYRRIKIFPKSLSESLRQLLYDIRIVHLSGESPGLFNRLA